MPPFPEDISRVLTVRVEIRKLYGMFDEQIEKSIETRRKYKRRGTHSQYVCVRCLSPVKRGRIYCEECKPQTKP